MAFRKGGSRVGILYSSSSHRRLSNMAEQEGGIYKFEGATRNVTWLKGEYAYLAPNGAASLMRRLCIKFSWVTDEDLIEPRYLESYHTLIVPHAIALPIQAHKALSDWVNKGGYLLATGQIDLPAELLGLSAVKWYQPKGYSAIDYGKYSVIAGLRGYTVGACQPTSETQVLASAYEVVNPQEGMEGWMSYPLGPAVLKTGKVLYISLPLFETFGAMLQGHVNFEDIRSWGHRFKYLDWLVRFVKEMFENSGWKHLWRVRVKPWGEYRGVVVLRHDVDESSDLTYLDFERKNGIPATYAVLDDRHRRHWLKAIASHPAAEAAYHFDSGPGKITLFNTLSGGSRRVTANVLKKTTGKGLSKQVRNARDVLSIPIFTAQRHNSYFFYPEIIDAMDYLYKEAPEVLGLGTMFRFTNIMFGGEKKEDGSTYIVRHPDTSVPFWFPFKLWYASTDSHYALQGWDITHVLEPEPWLTELLFRQEEYLEDGVFTFGFHPAHCWGKSFRQEGNWEWYKYAVELGEAQGYLFLTCKEVFERMNQWENLGFGVCGDEGWVENRHSTTPITVCLEHCDAHLLFKGEKTSIELLDSALTKISLKGGDKVHFSMG
jgi:hypothetical protein